MVTGPDVFTAGLSIAGLRVRVQSRHSVEDPNFPSEYASFLVPFTGEPDITVELAAGIPAEVSKGIPVTQAGPWRLFREAGRRVILWDGRDASSPLWAAALPDDNGTITVWCGDKFSRKSGADVTVRNPFRYPLDQLVLMFRLAGQGIILHAAGLVDGQRGIIAMGRSGAGKTTLSRLWADAFGVASVLSDDRVIAVAGSGPGFHGTPWPGELGAARNERAPLSALVFLKQARENKLVPMQPQQALEALMPVASIPWFDQEVLPAALECCRKLTTMVPAYEFQFTPTPDAVKVLAGKGC